MVWYPNRFAGVGRWSWTVLSAQPGGDLIGKYPECCGIGSDASVRKVVPVRFGFHGLVFTYCPHLRNPIFYVASIAVSPADWVFRVEWAISRWIFVF
jgi:hypothetical protein